MRGLTKTKIGRPPKFRGPRRPVTVTLPETTLARLAAIDADRARAIVKVTETALSADGKGFKQVELVEVAPGLGIIIIGPCQILQRIKGLRLVEVAPMRFLLVIPTGTTIDSVELAITDLLDDKRLEAWEHSTLSQLRDLIRSLRRQGRFSKAEMLFVDTGEESETRAEPGKLVEPGALGLTSAKPVRRSGHLSRETRPAASPSSGHVPDFNRR